MALQTDPTLIRDAAWCGPARPPEAPLAMPTQNLAQAPKRRRMPQRPEVYLARVVGFGGGALLAGYGAFQMSAVFGNESRTVLQIMLLALFTITFGWIALSACQAIAGLLSGRARRVAEQSGPLRCRVAILMPVYNEDPGSTCAALQAMGEGLSASGQGRAFEIFVLSDSTDPEVWARETACYAWLRANLANRIPVWYRRRFANTGRKAGNLRDFVERWGARYDYMLVLDADSLMDPETIVRMTQRMEGAPRLGILQTVPVLAGGGTLFARIQQFAGRLYGPVIANGVAAWQGDQGNYWGHNAMIRTRAFAECCGMPELPGRKPFGGHVLSHDFVEAALICRGGWQVRMDTDLGGSWEGSPQTLKDLAARDRRWAQGNLQHVKVVGARGLALSNRAHFLIGIGSYVMSPVWLAMLLVGALLTAQSLLHQREYFGDGPQLFPNWPVFDAQRMMWLLALAMTLLFLPKLFGLIRATCVPRIRRAYGGAARILGGSVVEILLSALLAPILMLFQVQQIIEILSGRDSGWSAQSRDAKAMPFHKAVRSYAMQVTIGASAAFGIVVYAPDQLIWVSPVLAGLILAPVLSWITEREFDCSLTRLLDIPEDRAPSRVAQRAAALGKVYAEPSAATPKRLLSDPMAGEAHLATLFPGLGTKGFGCSDKAHGEANAPIDVEALTARAKIEAARDVDEALRLMDRDEIRAVLGSPDLLRRALERFVPRPAGAPRQPA